MAFPVVWVVVLDIIGSEYNVLEKREDGAVRGTVSSPY